MEPRGSSSEREHLRPVEPVKSAPGPIGCACRGRNCRGGKKSSITWVKFKVALKQPGMAMPREVSRVVKLKINRKQTLTSLMLLLAVCLPIAWNLYFFNVITPTVPKEDREVGWAMVLIYGNLGSFFATILLSLGCSILNIYYLKTNLVINKKLSRILLWSGLLVFAASVLFASAFVKGW
jgi:hypothetical protein